MSFLPRMKKGFTLIELLVVIGVLTILLAIVLVAINPARQFSQTNDTQRRSDINALLNAIHQYAADNKGVLPSNITTTAAVITSVNTAALCADLVPKYLADIPRDPKNGTIAPTTNNLTCDATTTAYDTKYSVVKSATDGRVTVSATPEITPPNSLGVTR